MPPVKHLFKCTAGWGPVLVNGDFKMEMLQKCKGLQLSLNKYILFHLLMYLYVYNFNAISPAYILTTKNECLLE